jgi:type IV pilus assembly protein PilY1
VSASATTRGQELWAYVPRLVHANLAALSTPNYAHRYFVDGTPATAAITGAGTMTRILVGGLGKGGAGYYALDISTYAAATEADVASKVKWEVKPTNMGYSFGTPLIVNTAAGWRVVVASGYDNGTALGGDGQGYVWVLNPSTGAVEKTFRTGTGSAASPSGLAHLSRLANTTADAVVRYVYGGDLEGNVWRFDLEAADNSLAVRLGVLTDGSGSTQSVSAPTQVGSVSGSSTKYFVYVGTGRYFADADVPGNAGANRWATQLQTMYGFIDDTSVASPTTPNIRGANGFTCPVGGGTADFVCQAFTHDAGTNSYSATAHAVDSSLKRGWYIDMPNDTRLQHGRMTTTPALTTGGTLAFTVNVPTNVACDPGGSSWFFALSGANGGAVPRVIGGNTYYSAGMFLGDALASRPVILDTADGKHALIQKSDKTRVSPPIPEPTSVAAQWRRIYWRTLH